MVFAQLTWHESLHDIKVCLTANRAKLFHIGWKNVPARSALAEARNPRVWRIYHDLAMCLITLAKSLYADERLDLDLDATVYAPDATTSPHHCNSLQESPAGVVVLQMDQAALVNQEISGHQTERGEVANSMRRMHLRAHRQRQEEASNRCPAIQGNEAMGSVPYLVVEGIGLTPSPIPHPPSPPSPPSSTNQDSCCRRRHRTRSTSADGRSCGRFANP